MSVRRNNRKGKTAINGYQNFVSFSDIGGLSDHIRTLKELIIFPLVYHDVYDKFKIRPPRGVLFYGPPGTGKTLVAGAIAKECSKEINGKVTFFSRKGADILNKWVGESEEKLRTLFAEFCENQRFLDKVDPKSECQCVNKNPWSTNNCLKAAECHPAIIFFDEIDGLAPIRSSKQDQVHASVVATLLALMDGLDTLPGVVVIGATNRIDAVDPALRRPGRFDRELYFPLPAYNARREILEVHVNTWTVKPKPSFLSYLADITAGYSGSDIQALCSEAVMSCLRRNYPQIHSSKVNIRMRNLKVVENDFMTSRNNIMPSSNRESNPMRRLPVSVQPLLQRQLNQVVLQLQSKSPHFTEPNYKYNVGSKRYAGRLLLIGNQDQGHNTHLAPAILHALEHLPSYIIDIQTLFKCANHSAEEICVQKLSQARLNLPSIVLTYRLDEWWDIVEESTRAILISMLKDLHAGLPLLIIATATNDLPSCLTSFFSEPNSTVYVMEDPNEHERGNFYHTLFMESALQKCKSSISENKNFKSKSEIPNLYAREHAPVQNKRILKRRSCKLNRKQVQNISEEPNFDSGEGLRNGLKRKCSFKEGNRAKRQRRISESNILKNSSNISLAAKPISTWSPLFNFAKKIRDSLTNITKEVEKESDLKPTYINKDFVDDIDMPSCSTRRLTNIKTFRNLKNQSNKHAHGEFIIPGDSKVSNVERIKYLYRRVVSTTSKQMAVAQLELLYDMLATCINRENQDVPTMLENIGSILSDFETKQTEAIVQY